MATWDYVSVPRGAFRFPDCCAACLEPAPKSSLRIRSDLEYFKRRVFLHSVYESLWVQVPFCKNCAARHILWVRVGWCLGVLALISGIAVKEWLGLGAWLSNLLFMVFIVPAVWVLMFHRPNARVIGYTDNRVQFSFKHREYAREFAALNGMVEIVLQNGDRMYVPKASLEKQAMRAL